MGSPGVVFFLCVLGLGDAISGSTCPAGAIQIIQECISNMLPAFQPSGRSIESEIEIWRQACRDSSVTKASDCVKNVLDKCQGFTDEEQNVQRLFSHENIRKMGSYFCANFDLYVNNIRCVTSQHGAALNCSRPQMDSFRRKINANSPIEVMILSSCINHQVMTECLLQPVYTNCGGSAAMFLEEVTTMNRPPLCQPLTPKYKHLQSDDPKNGANSMVVTSATMWLIFTIFDLIVKLLIT